MAILFGRKYQVFIGEQTKLVEGSIPSPLIVPDGIESFPIIPAVDYLTIPSGIQITDLRIKARIVDGKQGSSTNADSSWIEVFNLSRENQQKIKVDYVIIIKAGYDQDKQLPLIYAGQVTKVTTRKKGTEVITKIQMGSASTVRRNVRVVRRPNRGETVQEIIEWFASVAAKNGIPTGNIQTLIDFTYPYGYAITGNLFEKLEELCSSHNLKTYMSLGKLYIEPIDFTEFLDTVVIESHNVKGSLRIKNEGAGKTSVKKASVATPDTVSAILAGSAATGFATLAALTATTNEVGKVDGVSDGVDPIQGLEFDTFLDGRISSSKKIKINFGDYKGDYKITSVVFKLDSRGKDWDTSVSCEVLNNET